MFQSNKIAVKNKITFFETIEFRPDKQSLLGQTFRTVSQMNGAGSVFLPTVGILYTMV